MAFLVIEVELPSESVGQINQQLVDDDSKDHEGVNAIKNVLDAVLAGAKDAQVSCYVRSTTASVSASGGGIDATYNLK